MTFQSILFKIIFMNKERKYHPDSIYHLSDKYDQFLLNMSAVEHEILTVFLIIYYY